MGKQIDYKGNPVYNTLVQLNSILDNPRKNLMYIAYNDDPINKTAISSRAHAKAVIIIFIYFLFFICLIIDSNFNINNSMKIKKITSI